MSEINYDTNSFCTLRTCCDFQLIVKMVFLLLRLSIGSKNLWFCEKILTKNHFKCAIEFSNTSYSSFSLQMQFSSKKFQFFFSIYTHNLYDWLHWLCSNQCDIILVYWVKVNVNLHEINERIEINEIFRINWFLRKKSNSLRI